MSVPLRVGVRPEDGEIVDVGPYRHKVIWTDGVGKSTIDYCNNCGSPFVFGPEDGPDYCPCGAPADEAAEKALNETRPPRR